ncbi:MAG: elongation factor P [Candidatus Buchananbacteria bacterium RIFCSPHIGHO2_01_FULL_47_11b]|uniref:Elongation factor P n=1 Tax=Candidatus Buchananbacteria bacterium RIFCSPHIGHO2_01_FULL_47_11b TaxID=1797537 RepID=A0A1G1Y3W0_9BACT|nr:MAG: elongation factor P [Candidatus Buchananbacteria bacterium RIFCSPHIGHO2_01_FULL_47_11b]
MAVLGALNDIKQGLTVVYNDEPYLVLQANFVRMQQRKPVMQTKMRHLITGKILEYSFKPGDRVETADIGRKKINFLYRAGSEYAFMDNQTFEQISFTAEQLGEQVNYLKDGCEVQLITFNDQPINIELPVKMDFKVTSTPEGAKGDTAQGKVTKPAEIETGATVAVPLFVKVGDTIRVNTETGEYVERV